MTGTNALAPEGAVEWRPELGPEGQEKADALLAKSKADILFAQKMREVLGMSQQQFLEFMQKDEFEGLPPHVSRNTLTFSKVKNFLEERGGSMTITITLNGDTFTIPA